MKFNAFYVLQEATRSVLQPANSSDTGFTTSPRPETEPTLLSSPHSFPSFKRCVRRTVMGQGGLDWTQAALTDLITLSLPTWGMGREYWNLIKAYGLMLPPRPLSNDSWALEAYLDWPLTLNLEGPWWRWVTLKWRQAVWVKSAKFVLKLIKPKIIWCFYQRKLIKSKSSSFKIIQSDTCVDRYASDW